jgi:hypothetical protein
LRLWNSTTSRFCLAFLGECFVLCWLGWKVGAMSWLTPITSQMRELRIPRNEVFEAIEKNEIFRDVNEKRWFPRSEGKDVI